MTAKLRGGRRPVFSKAAGSRARVGLEDAGRHARPRSRGRELRAVGRGRAAVRPAEARGEAADAAETDGEADVRDAAVGGAQQLRGALEPAREQVLVRRLAERPPELAAEVRRREPRGAGERG